MTIGDKELNGKGIPLLRASSEKEINFYFAYTHSGMYDLGIEGPGGTIWHSFPYGFHPPLPYLPFDRISFCSLASDQRSILFFTDTLYLAALANVGVGILRLRGGERPESSLTFLTDPRPERWGRRTLQEVLNTFDTTPQGLGRTQAQTRRGFP